MTSLVRLIRRASLVLSLAGALAVAGCGASTTTTTPAPASPASTPVAAATAAPSGGGVTNPKELGLFAVRAEEAVAFYLEQGFDCRDPEPSSQAAGYVIVRCVRENADTGTTDVVGLVHTPDGILGNAFAGMVTAAGTEGPTVPIRFAYLSEFLRATLGEVTGTKAAGWYGASLTNETERTAVDGLVVQHYKQDDANGVGFYVEIANEDFLTAPGI